MTGKGLEHSHFYQLPQLVSSFSHKSSFCGLDKNL